MVFKQFYRAPFGALIFCALTSCAFIGDRSSEYKDAEDGKALVVPESLSDDLLQERYRIPQAHSELVVPGKYVLPLPPDATASLSDDPYTIVAHDNDVWLELPMSPSKAWTLIDAFWQTNGFDAHEESVAAGYFSSEELNEQGSHQNFMEALEATSHGPIVIEGTAFQTRLRQGIRRNTSEVQVRALFPDASDTMRRVWQSQPHAPRVERGLLEFMAESITSRDQADLRYSLNAVEIGDESLVRILEDEAGYPYLELRINFTRSWVEVIDALNASSALISYRDKDEGVVTISYLSQEDIESWYTFESTIEELKSERNIELKFYAEEQDVIHVRAKLLNDRLEPESVRELIELVFEHIS
ncbi:hypothetical protein A3762_07215 [Oleiphilus sp. HI0125]|uniref:outer membrane protein assembly factor BamC n=1 Tax=Oleiphilus sp. HI0125 TaxID=1822266 RepID=UPI0007C33A19|nr:outer membrane protein assembly factor BamC [Oleiphilus sp. HI0125]KZZ58770.1 hypothetical protein A3762_07215 [Oleiphilus sp. HI0125]